jgi:SNF2 family DNA or RNA helicase
MAHVEQHCKGSFVPSVSDEPYLPFFNPAKERAGGFICDHTGLGKTRTVLEHIRRDWTSLAVHERRPTLVIVPPNIACQWKQECAKWVKDLPVFFMYGANYAKRLKDLFAS